MLDSTPRVSTLLTMTMMLCAAACGAQVEDRESSNGPDAGVSVAPDASAVGNDAGPDAAPVQACSNGRVVYLNFDGVTLTRGTSDATQNRAGWLQDSSGTAPPYRNGHANRAAEIMAITDGIRAQLASFPVTVVTTRPTAGQYVMIVFGGAAHQVRSAYSLAVNRLDCGDVQRNDVAWIADSVTPPQRAVNYAIGAIGFGLGLTATQDPADCMCEWANTCQQNQGVACKLTDNIARDPQAHQLCPGASTQSATLTFKQAFCQ